VTDQDVIAPLEPTGDLSQGCRAGPEPPTGVPPPAAETEALCRGLPGRALPMGRSSRKRDHDSYPVPHGRRKNECHV
jgi:hypothetical protein